MSENKNLMDTSPGGEQTQYEGQNTFVQPPDKEEGTFTDTSKSSDDVGEDTARGDKTAENIRYGHAMSEQGMGGQTVGMEGKTEQAGYGEIEDQSIEGQRSRRNREGLRSGDEVARPIRLDWACVCVCGQAWQREDLTMRWETEIPIR